jgi:6-phosphogluconolactonase (cycloisomerase 2 family)
VQLPGALGCVQAQGLAGCARGHALHLAHALALDRGGRVAYLASPGSSSLDIFVRDRRTGALHQLTASRGCLSEAGIDGCARARGIAGAHHVAISPDGRNLYVIAEDGSGVATFSILNNPRRGSASP